MRRVNAGPDAACVMQMMVLRNRAYEFLVSQAMSASSLAPANTVLPVTRDC